MIKNFIFSVVFVFTLSGCAVTPYSIRHVEHDMTKEEVIKKVGKPYTIKSVRDVELMTYYLHEDLVDFFISPKFPYFLPYPFIRTGHEYWVILEDNQVIAVGSAEIDFTQRGKYFFPYFTGHENRSGDKRFLNLEEQLSKKFEQDEKIENQKKSFNKK